MQDIKKAVCKYYKIKLPDLLIKGGNRAIRNAKRCFVILAKESGKTYSELRNELELTNAGMTNLQNICEEVSKTDEIKFALNYLRKELK